MVARFLRQRGVCAGRTSATASSSAERQSHQVRWPSVPQLEDITSKTGITFQHTADPSKKYIVESMSAE